MDAVLLLTLLVQYRKHEVNVTRVQTVFSFYPNRYGLNWPVQVHRFDRVLKCLI